MFCCREVPYQLLDCIWVKQAIMSRLSSKNLHLTKTPSKLPWQWPLKLSYTYGSSTSKTVSSWHTRPTIPRKPLFSLSRSNFLRYGKARLYSSYAPWLVSSVWHGRSSYLTGQIERVVWPWWHSTGLGGQLPQTLFSVCPNLIHPVQSHRTHFWCPPGFGAWTAPVYYVHYSS